jgi:hypothetical protein
MKKETIAKTINSEKLKDIPLLYVVEIISVILEIEDDYENRSKRRKSSDTDEVLIVIQ